MLERSCYQLEQKRRFPCTKPQFSSNVILFDGIHCLKERVTLLNLLACLNTEFLVNVHTPLVVLKLRVPCLYDQVPLPTISYEPPFERNIGSLAVESIIAIPLLSPKR